jgi:23S rRNA (pseudouridine1915-N3)-methyltransferase
MFHFKIVQIGETKDKNLDALIGLQIKRISQSAKIEIISLKDAEHGKVKNSGQKEQIILKEGEKILQKIKEDKFVIALDEHGQEFDSVEFANFLGKRMDHGINKITFVTGGCFGLAKEVRAQSQKILSLSKFTFTHEQARLMLMEQIYRALSILAGREYHY